MDFAVYLENVEDIYNAELSISLREQEKAERYAESFIEISSFTSIFEAENEKVKNTEKNNEKAVAGTENHFAKAIAAIAAAISRVIESIRVFFAEHAMDKKMKQAYAAYKAALQRDPTLKDKKISMIDIKKFRAEYESLQKELDDAENKHRQGINIDLGPITDKINEFGKRIKGAATGAATAVGMEFALNASEGCMDFAKTLNGKLKTDKAFADRLKKEVGSIEYAKFKHKVKAYSKDASFLRLRTKLKSDAVTSMEGAVRKTYDTIMNAVGGGKEVVDVMKDMDTSRNAERGKFGNMMHTAGYIMRNRKDLKGGIKKAWGAKDIALRAAGNEDIRDLAGKGMKIVGNISKQKEALNKERRDSIKYVQRHPDTFHQSMGDFFSGIHDKNSVTGSYARKMNKKK